MNLVQLHGAGNGGAGNVRTPREDQNTLRSRAYARVVDLLGEGPFEGFQTETGITIRDCVLETSPVVVDGALTFPNGFYFSQNSSGYPFSLDYPIYCTIDGNVNDLGEVTGTGAVIRVDVYPRTSAEQSALAADGDPGVPIYPEGRVRRLVLVSGGSGYSSDVRISIPPASGQSIYFDSVPVLSPVDLKPAFRDVRIEYRLGTEDQTHMRGFEFVETVLDGVQERYPIRKRDGAYTFQIDSKDYDRLVLNMDLREGFYVQDPTNGDILEVKGENTVRFTIRQQYRNSTQTGWTNEMPFGDGTYTFQGKTMSGYSRSIEGTLYRNSEAEGHSWKITIRRLTIDDEDRPQNPSSYHTNVGLSSVIAISDIRLTYPNCAIVGVEVNAEQFQSLPVRAYNVKMLRLQVPSNYFPPNSVRTDGTVRTFAEYNRAVTPEGIPYEVTDVNGAAVDQPWDGTFYESWTNNPAWIMYSILTHYRYGLGKYITGITDKWGLYSIGRHCDEVVWNGYFNGTYTFQEPRFTCSFYAQQREEAFKYLSDVATIFRGMLFWSQGAVALTQDRNKPVSMVFTKADVENGMFNYEGTSRKVRHTVAIFYFNDPSQEYKLTPVFYEDYSAMLRYGVQVLEVTQMGITSRGQARRAARYAIRSETSLTQTVTFTTFAKARLLTPGNIIQINDPVRSSVPFGGLVIALSQDAAGRAIVHADRAIPTSFLDDDLVNNYRVVFSRPRGWTAPSELTTSEEADANNPLQVTEPARVFAFGTDAEGRVYFILESGLPEKVGIGSVWGLQSSVVAPQLFRILGISEEGPKINISALEFQPAIYDEVDRDDPYYESPINPDLTAWKLPNPPESIRLFVNARMDQSIQVYDMTVSWERPSVGFVREYQVWLRQGLGNYQLQTITPNTSATFRLTLPANYCVRVMTVGISGSVSTFIESCMIVGQITGDNAEIISGLEVRGQANDNNFYTSELVIDWRVNWSGAASTLPEGQPPVLPPGVVRYLVTYYDPSDVVNALGVFKVRETQHVLSLDQNASFVGGPRRDLIVSVNAETDDGGLSATTSIRVTNPQPEAPTFSVADDQNGSALIRVTSTKSQDFRAYRVWASQSGAGFTPSDSNLVAESASTLITVPLETNVLWYIKLAETDLLFSGNSDCIPSSAQTVTVTIAVRLSAFDFLHR